MKNKRTLKSGFSLIEILVSIAVAAVVFPAVIALMSFSTFTTSQGETYTKAYAIAQKDMEIVYELKKDWTSFSPMSAVTPSPAPGFNQKIEVFDLNPADVNAKRVVVTVSWDERGATPEPNVIIESIVSNI